jgi:hypothetical protein
MDIIKDMWDKYKPLLNEYKVWVIGAVVLLAILLFS